MVNIMQDIINKVVEFAVGNIQNYGPLFGGFLILLESIFPVLPLGVFIAFNMISFGNIMGFILSWIFTLLGCCLSYYISGKISDKGMKKLYKKYPSLDKFKERIKNIKFSNFVLIVALPFTPAFLVNIASGIVKMDLKKFILGVMIGKISIIYFWGFISKSLLESITDLKTIIIVVIMLFVSYVVSKLVNKKLNIE